MVHAESATVQAVRQRNGYVVESMLRDCRLTRLSCTEQKQHGTVP